MKFGIAIRKNETDYFVHQSYIFLLRQYGNRFDFITLETDLSSFDAFLLPGGYDINPLYYHQENYASKHIDKEMDSLDKKIVEYCLLNKKPLLGICRGMQSINVFLGGTLKQNITHHMNENHFIYFDQRYVLVNSFHHQSIDKLAPNLEVLGTSLDGEIEIVRHKTLPIYGVQFHPELFSFDLNFFFNVL